MRDWNLANEDALMYFPRILAHDKLRGRFESFAPCGAVAGMLARADDAWPPCGMRREGENAVLRPGYRPSLHGRRGLPRQPRLARRQCHPIAGARPRRTDPKLRTLAAGAARAADWKYLSARRLALFIVNSIAQGTRWVAMAQPHLELASLGRIPGARFLREACTRRARFPTRGAEDAYFVICDRRVNSESAAIPWRFRLLIGFAAARIGEFHAYRITHSAEGSEVVARHPQQTGLDASSVGGVRGADDRRSLPAPSP